MWMERESKWHGTVYSCIKSVTLSYINQTYKNTRFFNFPNEGGMVPDMLLLYKSKLTRLLRFPSSLGIVPWMLFLYNSLHPTKREPQSTLTNIETFHKTRRTTTKSNRLIILVLLKSHSTHTDIEDALASRVQVPNVQIG
jgi:hypothetical protein